MAQVFSIMFVVIKRIYLNLIQTMTLLTFLSRLYCFSFKDPSFWGVFWWVFFQKYILRIQNNIVHFYGKQESSKDNNESFGPCSNPLLIWIVVNGKYMIVWYISNYVTILQVWILVCLFCQYINLTANVNQSKFCYFVFFQHVQLFLSEN